MRLLSFSPSAVLASVTLHAAGLGLYHLNHATPLIPPSVGQEVKIVEVAWEPNVREPVLEANGQIPDSQLIIATIETASRSSTAPQTSRKETLAKAEPAIALPASMRELGGQGMFSEQCSRGIEGVQHNNPFPHYPEYARREGFEGVVWLRIRINAEGKVERLEILQSSGYQCLDDNAVDSVQEWVFKPAVAGSRPIASEIDIPIEYALEKN